MSQGPGQQTESSFKQHKLSVRNDNVLREKKKTPNKNVRRSVARSRSQYPRGLTQSRHSLFSRWEDVVVQKTIVT